jgi:outer membrane immunogenic protein
MRLKLRGSALAALIGATAAAHAASAADLTPRLGGVEAPPAFSWSGFYLGVHGGYGWGSSDWTVINIVPPPSLSSTANPRSAGLLGGIQVGADHQFGNWVLGVGADFSLINGTASSASTLGINPTVAHSEIDWLTTFTARFGYAVDRSLFYVKGGMGGAEFKDDYLLSGPAAAVDSGTLGNIRVGWTIGAGYEYAVFDNWTARIEYDYLDFGSTDENFVFSGVLSAAINQSIERKLQLVSIGIGYKF